MDCRCSFKAFGVILLHFNRGVFFFARMGNTHSGKPRKSLEKHGFPVIPANSHPCLMDWPTLISQVSLEILAQAQQGNFDLICISSGGNLHRKNMTPLIVSFSLLSLVHRPWSTISNNIRELSLTTFKILRFECYLISIKLPKSPQHTFGRWYPNRLSPPQSFNLTASSIIMASAERLGRHLVLFIRTKNSIFSIDVICQSELRYCHL
jgi:hypothetical protein